MSGLFRLRVLQGLTKNVSLVARSKNLCRKIGTSSKKNVTEVTSSPEDLYPVKKNWVSWGFDTEDKRMDRHIAHLTFFVSVTVCLVLGSYYSMFLPNKNMIDWAQREAYLELRRREELGLPPVDSDYFDLSEFQLPTDEELGDTEVII
ncbi:NADH dehydrogenase [ubiquinone] 1 beta subcomplex subunit 11, mitochondrial [Leptopilina heterotoma]|uniref:NADH dehydrogenase [ubiquinone] 1 beta subcomplex subunit 11, mitochondrial n=1 Tax=Leptopilina heterotoma TaxID=63436 RepID=UPI001CA8A717|nr:NADH dehydrogenase [ubiquinone] 1 beta subcomplex subunit 11, mitochondrial [Leptopilina heterotoma]